MATNRGFSCKNQSTSQTFDLIAGMYGVQVIATWGGGTVVLNRLSNDGSTYVSTGVSFSANSFQTVQIPEGNYQLAVTTATAVYAEIMPIAINADK